MSEKLETEEKYYVNYFQGTMDMPKDEEKRKVGKFLLKTQSVLNKHGC